MLTNTSTVRRSMRRKISSRISDRMWRSIRITTMRRMIKSYRGRRISGSRSRMERTRSSILDD